MERKDNYKKIAFSVAVAISLIVIGYFSLNPKQDIQTSSTFAEDTSSDFQQPKDQQINNTLPEESKLQKQTNVTLDTDPKAEETSKTDDAAIKILKSEVTSRAKFYPYTLDGIKMELLAVKATDGTIRTALNTCQICYRSGRGYYVQSGDYLVCQNCGNRFHINQVEVIKGGCNPIPVIKEDKQDAGDYIVVTESFMASSKEYFSKWKKA